MINKTNIILADCCSDEILSFKKGCEDESGLVFSIQTSISNLYHGSFINRMRRYLSYFSFPFLIFLQRKKYSMIIGWQQFHSINFAFYCALFHLSVFPEITAVNFTYKEKKGILGKLYKRYFSYVLKSGYISNIHVLSYNYAEELKKTFKISPRTKFVVTPFGIPDNFKEWSQLKCEISDFTLSLGRSNRDFDFLVEVWKQSVLHDKKLVIISDTWTPSSSLPENIIHLSNIKVADSYAYIANCDVSVVSVIDGNLCSGDTVLLNSMMMAKPVVITIPSTLSEMYIKDGENGLYIPKKPSKAAEIIALVLSDKKLMNKLSEKARSSYLSNFSRYSMGYKLIQTIQGKTVHNV